MQLKSSFRSNSTRHLYAFADEAETAGETSPPSAEGKAGSTQITVEGG